MPEVIHSPFLQALGYAIINSLWQFALLWLIYVTINTVFKLSPHHKYSAGLLLQFAGFAWVAITFAFYFSRFSRLPDPYYSTNQQYFLNIAQVNAETVRQRFLIWILQSEKLLPWLSISYLALLIFSCFKWIKAYNYSRTIRTKGLQKIGAAWQVFVTQLSIQLVIEREVKIYLSEMVSTPLTIGFFKPLILLPLASINHLNTEQMEAVIMHELAHIKRFDYLFNLFLAFIEVALFFNPFMSLMSRHIKRERENCCDDWVLQYEYNAATYARALLQIATSQSSSAVFAMKAAEDKDVLLIRIKRMIEKKEKTFFNYRYQLMAFFVMLVTLSSLALLSRHDIDRTISPSSHAAVVTPTEIVLSPLYNPDFFIASPKEKGINYNRYPTGKITNEISNIDTVVTRITSVENKNRKQKAYVRSLSAEKNPPVPQAPENPPTPDTPDEPIVSEPYGDVSKDLFDIQISNTVSNKVVFPPDVSKECKIALAEEQLKQLTIHLFEQNKAVIDQKQLIAELKAAFEQIKAAKIELQLAKQQIRVTGQKRVTAKENQLRIMERLSPCDIDKLQRVKKDLQAPIDRAKKQLARVSELNSLYNNKNNFSLADIIYRLPFAEKPHSFSYEFSAPKVKVVVNPSFYKSKRGKKINKACAEERGEMFETENASPVILNKLAEKDNAGVDSFIVIRI